MNLRRIHESAAVDVTDHLRERARRRSPALEPAVKFQQGGGPVAGGIVGGIDFFQKEIEVEILHPHGECGEGIAEPRLAGKLTPEGGEV